MLIGQNVTIRDTDDIEDIKMQTRVDLENDIKVLLAGRAAEKIIFGTTSIGCSNDISRASVLAYNMLYHFSMMEGHIINPDALRDQGITILSDNDVMDRVDKILVDCNKSVEECLEDHKDDIIKLAKQLMKDENIYDYDILNFKAESIA